MTKETNRISEELTNISSYEWKEVETKLHELSIQKESQKSNYSKNIELERKFYELMKELGLPSRLIGYNYLKIIVIFVAENPKVLEDTMKLYAKAAREFSTTRGAVERAIRHSLKIIWDRGNIDKVHEIFGYTFSQRTERITNSEFIEGVVDYIQNS